MVHEFVLRSMVRYGEGSEVHLAKGATRHGQTEVRTLATDTCDDWATPGDGGANIGLLVTPRLLRLFAHLT